MPETPIAFDNVEVLRASDRTLRCRVGTKDVTVGRLQVMHGTTVAQEGDRGRLVLPRWAVRELGLPEAS
jgi:hypothetical protein